NQLLAEADGGRLEHAITDLTVRIEITFANPLEHGRDGKTARALHAHRLPRGAVQLDDVLRAGALMQAVDVLGHHHRGTTRSLQVGDRAMGGVRLRLFDAGAEPVLPAL